jgi:predicted nucleic acid-binding protein
VLYVDSSAMTKLIALEPESDALHAFVGDVDTVSSRLLRTEVLRAVRRIVPELLPSARERLGLIDLVEPAASTWELAGTIDPPELRSLDALHLATALELGDEIEALVTYDRRLAAAARAQGLRVESPT